VLESGSDLMMAVAYSQDAKLAAVGGADGGVRVFAMETGKRLWSSRVHSDWVTSVSFSPDGRFLASASKDMTVKVYEVRDGTLYTTYSGHNRQIGRYKGASPVFAVRFEPEGHLAVSAGGGKWIQLWDPLIAKEEAGDAGDMEERFAKAGHARYVEHGFTRDVYALALRGKLAFAASADGLVKQIDLASGKEIRSYAGLTDWAFGLDYDPASKRVAAGSSSGEIRVWDAETGNVIAAFKNQPGAGPLPR
jgi:WD40 repeat protein